jgi:hypothetical protein
MNARQLTPVKNLDDIQSDMSALYDTLLEGSIEIKVAAELANIAGKFLKAEQLKLAREIFLSGQNRITRNRDAAEALTVSAG